VQGRCVDAVRTWTALVERLDSVADSTVVGLDLLVRLLK